MIEQTIHTQAATGGALGEAGQADKAEKGGVFAKLMAVFQKHIKEGETTVLTAGKSVTAAAKTLTIQQHKLGAEGSLKGLQLGKGVSLEAMQAKVAGAELKLVKGQAVDASGKGLTVAKSMLLASNAEAINVKGADKAGAEKADSVLALVGDSEGITQGLLQAEQDQEVQKHALVGLAEATVALQTQLEDKNNQKNTLGQLKGSLLGGEKGQEKGLQQGAEFAASDAEADDGIKKPQTAASKAGMQNNKAELPAQGLSLASKSETGQALGQSSHLQQVGKQQTGVALDQSLGVDEKVSIKVKPENAKVSAVKLNAAGSNNDDGVDTATLMTKQAQANQQDDGVKLEASKLEAAKAEVLRQENAKQMAASGDVVSKQVSGFKPVTGHKNVSIQNMQHIQVQTNTPSVNQQAVMSASSSSAQSDMQGDDGLGRSAAELMATDLSNKDARIARNDFSMQMAYRSGASFKPADAMLEISKAARDGTVKMELQLEPATLGKIQVTLQTDASKQIQVHLSVDQNASRQLLEQQLPQLRQALEDQGLNLSGFTMDMNSQQQEGSGERGFAKNSTHAASDMDIAQQEQDGSTRLGVNMASDGGLNILA